MSNLSNMDNYIRILYLVFETAPYALRKLMLQYLNQTNMSLPDLINKHQHEIYHYFTDIECCICTTTPSKCRFGIRKEQLMELFDTSPNAKRLTDHKYPSVKQHMCCRLAKHIVVENLDFTLLRFLIINFCEDEFWICFLKKYENDFEKFLSDEKHKLYHLWKLNVACCECRTGNSHPDKSIINPDQFKNMYVTIPSKCGKEDTCHFKPEHGLTFKKLKTRDKVLFTSLTNYFCNVRKAIEAISIIRNSRIAHVKSMDMSKNEFESLWKLMKDSLLEIAASTQSETEIIQRIEQCAKRDLDIAMGQRWMRELLLDQDLNQMMLESLNEAKEDHEILYARMDAQSKMLEFICEHIQKITNIGVPTGKVPQSLKDEDSKDPILSNQLSPEAFIAEVSPPAIEVERNLQEYSVITAELTLIWEKKKIQRREFCIEGKENGNVFTDSSTKEGLELENTSSDEGNHSFFESETEKKKVQDTHTCGRCGEAYATLDMFVNHKIVCASKKETTEHGKPNASSKDSNRKQVRMVFHGNEIVHRMNGIQLQKCSSGSTITELAEQGSLVLWIKMSSSVMKKKESFMKEVDEFVFKLMDKCPVETDEKTTLTVKIDVIENLEGYEDDEDDVFKCGRCLEEFHSVALFCSHKRKCNEIRDRGSTTQRISSGIKQIAIQEHIPSGSDRTTMSLRSAHDVTNATDYTSRVMLPTATREYNVGEQKLYNAAGDGDVDLVQDCLQKGADVNYTDDDGQTPLHLAAERGRTEVVDLLLKSGASLSVVDKQGQTPLHRAALSGRTEVVDFLLKSGASLSVVDKKGKTPLHWAAVSGSTEVVDFLLKSGASLSVVDNQGQTPLHRAVVSGSTEVVDFLLKSGASLSAVDNQGKKPHDLAHGDVKKLLQNWERELQTGIPLEVKQMDTESAAVFTNLLKEESYHQFQTRAMLIGEKGTGKTTVARFLVGKGPTEVRISTEGIDLYTALAYIDRETDEWQNGKQDFTLEDVMVSKSLRQAIDPMNPELPDTSVVWSSVPTAAETSSQLQQSSLTEPENKEVSVPTAAGAFSKQQQSSLNEPEYKEVSVSTAAGAFCKQQQSSLNEPENKEVSVPTAAGAFSKLQQSSLTEPENTEVPVPAAAGAFNKLQQSSLNKPLPENKEVPLPSVASVVRKPSIIDKVKSFFGVRKDVDEIKISVTQKEFLKKSWKVSKKKLHQRKIVPVIIWDFGGQDVFYSTHQTFLTYRAIYMLVLDGSRTLDEPCPFEQYLPGKGGAKTQRDYVRFWINTIVTYCKGSGEGYPKIMVILTHKDKVEASAVSNRRLKNFSEIKKMFEGTPVASHLVIDDQIFVNARDKTDPEMEQIKKTIIQEAKHQPTWGQTLPKCFLPLELEIAAQVRKGVALITMDDWKKINAQQAIRPLTDPELKVFLKFHHAVGTILYFDELNLDQHIILMPTHLIDAFKSIITDKIFCKGDRQKKVWDIMDSKGIILKQDVDQIWGNKKYSKFRNEKDYLLAVMTHLDILVEPKRYDPHSHSRIPTDFYYVASMIRKLDNTGYLQSPSFYQRNIAIVFDMNGTIIPPALSFRFISYCLSIWGVKTYGKDNELMLFHKSAVFTIDPLLDMYVQCEDEHIIVRLVHARNRALIMSDLASSILECLISALHKISRLYINTSSDRTEVDVGSFRLKVCCSSPSDPCFLPLEEERIIDGIWRCPTHHMEMGKGVLLFWLAEKENETCKPGCPVTRDAFLQQLPTHRHLQRLSLEYNIYEVRNIMVFSGLPYADWKALYISTKLSDEMKKFEGLKKCYEKNALTFKKLKKVVEKDSIQTAHTFCKVLRDKFIDYDLEPEKWDLVLTDEFIDKLAPLVGSQSLQFLLELDMTFQYWEQIKSIHKRDLVKLNRDILETWKQNCYKYSVRPTLRDIGRAFGNIGKHIKIIENTLFD